MFFDIITMALKSERATTIVKIRFYQRAKSLIKTASLCTILKKLKKLDQWWFDAKEMQKKFRYSSFLKY
jgi:hypothetical protein